MSLCRSDERSRVSRAVSRVSSTVSMSPAELFPADDVVGRISLDTELRTLLNPPTRELNGHLHRQVRLREHRRWVRKQGQREPSGQNNTTRRLVGVACQTSTRCSVYALPTMSCTPSPSRSTTFASWVGMPVFSSSAQNSAAVVVERDCRRFASVH